jgi:hypothetical protein
MSVASPSEASPRHALEAAAVSAGPPIRQVPPVGSPPPEELDDQFTQDQRDPSLSGMWLLAVLGAAALVVVGAVWVLSAAGHWWLLGPAMAVHLSMTALVVWLCLRLASDGELADDVP